MHGLALVCNGFLSLPTGGYGYEKVVVVEVIVVLFCHAEVGLVEKGAVEEVVLAYIQELQVLMMVNKNVIPVKELIKLTRVVASLVKLLVS